jgi:mannosyltransferase OCH1-like enzyme
MIPKIIHQIGPEDRRKWHPIWNQCHKTWTEIYKDYKFIFWNDEDRIDSFIKEKYPERYNFYQSLPFHIMKLDFVRYAILDYYGGVYADLDLYCYENIFDSLSNKICLIEPIKFWDNPHEMMMTCLMASEPNQEFWKECMDCCESNYNKLDKNIFDNEVYELFNEVLSITGPISLLNVYLNSKHKDIIQLLQKEYFHPSPCYYFEGMKTKHMKTTLWGKDAILLFEDAFRQKNLNYTDGMITFYNDTKHINLNLYDYKTKYEEENQY